MDWYTATAHTSPRNPSGRTVSRREQRGQLEINYREDWTTDEQQGQLEIIHHED
jgi:hypothetical protein